MTDISEQTGVEFDTSKLSDSLMIDKILTVNDQSGEKTYKEPFDGFTMQQVVGYIAQLHGTFAICDRNGKVTFRWYEALTTDYPGKIGDTAGSYLKDQNLSFIYNTIEFLKESHTYLIKTNRYFDDLLQSETMCQISGISCDTENNHYESGTNINTNLSNPVMTQEWLNKILKKIKDMSYYPVSFSFMGDPRLDVGDVVTIVDAKNNLIDVPVMQHTITFDGGLLSEVSSYGFEEKEVKSPSEIALQRIKDDILSLQEITAKKATFNQLNAVDAKITNLQASSITVNDANILFARLDKANIQQGWITNVMIGDAQITNAKIKSIDATKITTGTITGLDAIFNRSFKVDSPYSDTDSFIIESSSNGVTIATRTKGVVASTNDNRMFLGNEGLDIRCGTGPMRIWANDVLTIRTDSEGQINLEVQGLNSPNPPVYVKSDAGAFKIYHEGNFGSSASYKTGLKIGSITQGSSVTDFYVPLATTSASGLISADEKKKINVDYLPKSGGTIDNSNVDVLGLNCTSGTMSTLRFYGSGKRLGSVGFNAQNSSLYRWNTSGTAYRILDENDLPLMTDSGWVNITLGSEITAVSYIGARVRKIGNIVNVVMGVTGATAAFQTLGTLTQGYRPSKEINLAARYYNSPTAAISIGTDGTIKLLQTASGGSSYNASGAISFSITYFI